MASCLSLFLFFFLFGRELLHKSSLSLIFNYESRIIDTTATDAFLPTTARSSTNYGLPHGFSRCHVPRSTTWSPVASWTMGFIKVSDGSVDTNMVSAVSTDHRHQHSHRDQGHQHGLWQQYRPLISAQPQVVTETIHINMASSGNRGSRHLLT